MTTFNYLNSSELERLREAIKRWPTATHEEIDADGGIGDVIFAAAGRWLALTETGPDYEAAHRYGDRYGISPEDVNGILDAALADYLTEEK